MNVTQLNHVAIHCADVARSSDFYSKVLGLESIPRPAFDFPGAWFRIGRDQELHLIGRAPQVHTMPRERHYALMVEDIEDTASHLRRHGIDFVGPRPRPDLATQIFLHDPDGHVVELCTPPPGQETITASTKIEVN